MLWQRTVRERTCLRSGFAVRIVSSICRDSRLESGGYQFALDTRLPFETDRFEEVVYTDTTPENWFSTTRAYADWVDRERAYEPFPVVPACYYPMYDLWYWAFDDTNNGLYWTTLTRAKQLGFQSYLFDAGWESRPGEVFKWLEGTVGDYTHPEDKLPSFPGFLQYVKDRLRMNVSALDVSLCHRSG